MTTAERIIRVVIGFEEWCEENKKQFIKKNNPELYKKQYGQNIQNKMDRS